MLRVEHLSLWLGSTLLVRDLNLSVGAGEVAALMGPSGSGKSTVLNWLVGDLPPAFAAQGELWLGSNRVDPWPTEARHIGILFQDDLLFAHLSVGENLAFALREGVRGAARRAVVEQTLANIGLRGYHDRDPATLSGGERARVSLMRALLARPRALLLDEPFAKLDAMLRQQFRDWVFARVAELGLPTLLVTHDPCDVPAGAKVLDLARYKPGH